MTFLGMGTLEALVILLVGFIFLGPERLVTGVRMVGKLMKQVRGMANDMSTMIVEEVEDTRPSPYRPQGPRPATGAGPAASQGRDQEPSEEAPVAFRRTQATPPQPQDQEGAEAERPRRVRTH